MKKNNKPNPLKFFNDNRAAAYKKAGGAMKNFKKSLPKAQEGIIGPQNNYWFNSPEKRAMRDAGSRYFAAQERSNNFDENAQRDYKALMDNYQPQGPVVPLADQVAELNKKYPYYDNLSEVEYKGGDLNKGYSAMYKKADKKDSFSREGALKDAYPNVGTGLIKKKGGPVRSKKR
jgi:hypothetical protein